MKNENVKEFTQEVENATEETIEVVEVKKEGVIARFKALKTWQKALVITLVVGAVAGSGVLIYKIISNKPEVVSAAIDTVVENPELAIESVKEIAA